MHLLCVHINKRQEACYISELDKEPDLFLLFSIIVTTRFFPIAVLASDESGSRGVVPGKSQDKWLCLFPCPASSSIYRANVVPGVYPWLKQLPFRSVAKKG